MIEARDGRRVVITGLGVVSPAGTGTEEFWAGLRRSPEPCVERKVVGFDAAQWGIKHVQARRMDPFAQYAVAAAVQALADASLDTASPYAEERCGVVLGTGIGGAYAREAQGEVLLRQGAARVSPLLIPMVMPNAGAAAISMRSSWRGPVETVCTACAAGTHAVANGAKLVASGRCDAVLVGGSEASQNRMLSGGFTNMKALSDSGISRPFDVDRDGFCSAEAAGILVLEEASAAQARGAHIYAEIAGCASTADAHHLTAPAPDGRGATACMRAALADAGLLPHEITHINAHGTSTQLNDSTEAAAVTEVFGPGRPAVTSIKGVTGHSLGAAGAMEAVALALSYHHRELPPTTGTQNVDPAFDIDLVAEPRAWTPGPALSNSFAFGGHNGTVVFLPA
ncbi:MAG: beta-ketoacyl-[acyl-carrier-protein] synthase family protein [Geodermatophilaceae bacterium]|nr:beta-ketoacyl-[acyl-carrier-protein] synthase family protein [Geodermatophilaceae bacterium]MDQ3456393.1 beta-ketoacyl-[acyl-carrier-protein] synthase family protein [Actinomycetota bacterium]